MRTNIEIDDELMGRAMEASGAATKKAAVEEALRLLVQIKGQGAMRGLWGKVVWRGHDDDWLASDEEILKKRQEAVRDSLSAPKGSSGEAGPELAPMGGHSSR
jgi:Arc/MetJ family transcription regulator